MIQKEVAKELIELAVEFETGRDAHHPMQETLQLRADHLFRIHVCKIKNLHIFLITITIIFLLYYEFYGYMVLIFKDGHTTVLRQPSRT